MASAEFAQSVLRVASARSRPVVVKLGGSAMEDPAATETCLKSIAALHFLGLPIVVVHGGGKPIDRAMAEAGLTPRKVAGRRYTDDATLEIVVRVLGGIASNLAERLTRLGCDAFGCPVMGVKHFPLIGELLRLPVADGSAIDLGRVGTVNYVFTPFLQREAVEKRRVVLIPSLAHDADGAWLNVNADTAASAVAGALHVEKAIFLTDTPGILRNRTEPASRIPRLSEVECRGLITSGVIDGGMIPKVEACFEALAAGAASALILDGRVPYSLLDVFLRDTFSGTEITR